MNKLKKWAFGGAKDADYGGGGGGYYGQDYNSPGGEYDPTLPVNKVQQTKIINTIQTAIISHKKL